MKNKESRPASSVKSGQKSKPSIMDADQIKQKITQKNKSANRQRSKSNGPTKTQIDRMKVFFLFIRNSIILLNGFPIVPSLHISVNLLLRIMDMETLSQFMEGFFMGIICFLIISIL